MPFGVASAPAIFQKTMEALIAGIEGVVCFLDDILISGKTKQEHETRLIKVLIILQNSGLKIAMDKCTFFQKSVTYLGFVIDKEGLHPSTDKIKSIKEAPIPQNVTQLKSFLGLVNYYGKFFRNLSALLHPLYTLLKKDIPWQWSNDCHKAYEMIKNKLTSDDVLIHFQPFNLPVRLIVDASNYGIGALICHLMEDKTERPIAFASRTLSSCEVKYSQIEKEALAIIYGLDKFNEYLYGIKFTIVTDHKPLWYIFHPNKGIPQFSANRLRRWAVILSNYDYHIEYVKSDRNIADSLSRLPMDGQEIENFENNELDFCNYFSSSGDIQMNFKNIQVATQKDCLLQKIIKCVKNGNWPSFIFNDNIFKPFYLKRYEFSIEANCLIWINRLVIPQKCQSQILQQLHITHLGIVKMKGMARSYFWWPNIDRDIEELAKQCEACNLNSSSPGKSE